MSYNNNIIQTLGVDDESTHGKKLSITVAVDTLGMCTISFGANYSIRIPEDDVDAFREVLFLATREQNILRLEKSPGIDTSSLREADQRRKDKKFQSKYGLVPMDTMTT